MKLNQRNGIWIGVFFLFALVFFMFSGYILPGRDPDIGAFQLALILVCAVASLCAFDFALLWPQHSSLSRQDWFIAAALVFAGLLVLNIGNILNELHLVKKFSWPVVTSINYIGNLIVMSGLYWRFQIQLDGATRNIVAIIKRSFLVRSLQKYLVGLLLMAVVLFLLVGVILAYMETPGIEVILNPFRLLFLLLSLFLVGRSVLRFFLGNSQPLAVQMLAPLAGMTLWALVLGVGVGFHIPVWLVSIPLWVLTIFMAWGGFNRDEIRVIFPWIVLAVGITLLATFPYVINGFSVYLGSPLPDGWSYIAYGQYLWRYERGINAGLQPLYQYAAHLSHGRYVGSSLLGFLSPITGHIGDTQSSSGFFFPVVFFVYLSSVLALGLQRFRAALLRTSFIVIAALSGWTFTVISANNLDQAMILAFLPGMALLMETPQFDRPRWTILVGCMLAACTYIYPEMAVFIAFTIMLFSLEKILRQKLLLKHWLLGGLGVLTLVIILLSPFLSDLYPFLHAQFGLANRANRPGGNLAGELLTTKYGFMALWGLGANLFSTSAELVWYYIRLWSSYFFAIFLSLGIFLQVKVQKFGTIVIAIIFIAVIYYYIHSQSYAYAAYKLISISWWLMAILIVEGMGFLSGTRHYFIKYTFQFLYLGILLVFLSVFLIRSKQFASSFDARIVTPYRQLETLPIAEGDPLIASIWGWLPNQWAMYYLRYRPTLVYPYRSYANQAHVIPLMEQAAPVNYGDVRSILTDHENPFHPSKYILWRNQFYTLWEMPAEWAYVAEVIDPHGKVQPDQPNTLWLTEDTNLVIIASRTRKFNFTFDVAFDSPNAPGNYAFIIAPSDEEIRQNLTPGQQIVTLPLTMGRNQIRILFRGNPSLPGSVPTNPLLKISNVELIFQP